MDIVVRFCKAYGYGLNLHNVELTSFIAGIEAGKYDLGADESAKTMDVEPYHAPNGTLRYVRDPS